MTHAFQRLSSKPFLSLAVKSLALLLLLALLYWELTDHERLGELWARFLAQMTGAQWYWLALTLLLMPLNWLAETQKWAPWLRQFEPMSTWKALNAVLAGVAVSLFTPNRVGEFGGRILFVRPENQWKATLANLVGNYAQLLVLFTAGAAGLCWTLAQRAYFEPFYLRGLTVLALIGLILLYGAYFNMKAWTGFFRNLPGGRLVKAFVKKLEILSQFTRPELGGILKWAALRYGIYASQYFFLLKFFELKTSVLEGFAGISTLFLIQSSIPLPPLTGLVARGNLAIQTWGAQGENEISCLAATFALWIINLILPAFVGTFSLLFVNRTKTFVYENDPA